jgi:hypothetical protein
LRRADPISVEPIGSRGDRRSAWRHGQRKIAPPERRGFRTCRVRGMGDGGRDPAMQYKNAQGPSWFHRRSKGPTSLIAGNRRRPSRIGAVGGSLSAALGPTSILARDPDVLAPEKGRAVGRRVLQPRPFVGGLAGVLVVYAALGNAFAGPPVSFIVTVLGPAGETMASRTAASFNKARHAEQAGVWGRPKNWRWYF